jgi:protein-disulfide isomerase
MRPSAFPAVEASVETRSVESDMAEGRRSGVSGTPTFIVDGKPVVGAGITGHSATIYRLRRG